MWGQTTNRNLGTLIESSISGLTSVSVTTANQALTALNGTDDQARHAVLSLTTTTTAAFAVYAPPASKTYIVRNTTAYTATIYTSTVLGNTTAAGIGIAVPAGKTLMVFTDGTNFRTIDAVNLTGTLAVANGGTGAVDATAARANLGLVIGTNVPAPTGTGASGTWGISITGNAATANNLTATLGIAGGGTGATTAAAAFTALKQAATDTATGVVELATSAEVQTGTDTTRAVTPAGFRAGSLGYGQTWQDVSASRAINTNYTNSTGKPIQLFITSVYGAGSGFITVDGVVAGFLVGNNSNPFSGANCIVPPGGVYRTTNITSFQNWSELR